MDGRYETVVIDIFLADPLIEWWIESSDPARCKHAYHIELPFRDASDEDIFEAMFYYLNVRHPEDYKNRSLSVGDIVTLNNERSYLCAPLGWQKLRVPLLHIAADSCSSPRACRLTQFVT